jgi:HSP20 family protein
MLMRFESFRGYDPLTQEQVNQRRVRQIPVDAYRRGNELVIHLDLPGIDPGSIELTVEKDVLSVRATRTWVPAENDQIQIAERAQGEFSRQLFLGESLDREQITATYENGVLTATIPVAEEAKPRRVEIAHAGGELPASTVPVAAGV